MSYTAHVYNVMIASPSDVAAERAVVREVLHEWNVVHSEARKIVLLPVGWDTHTSPEMGASPQQIINKQILGRCDLLVGVFWTRLGTPTKDHLSGTVEEIEEHVDSGRPAMLYFSSQPVALDTVNLDDMQRLKAFKKSCQSRGLYEQYDSLGEFKETFYRQLQLKLNDRQLFPAVNSVFTETSLVESATQLPNLTQEARILLKEASQDQAGTILCIHSLSGTHIETNSKNFIAADDRREVAKWEDALKQLVSNGFAVSRGQKGEIFEITNLGYQVADSIVL